MTLRVEHLGDLDRRHPVRRVLVGLTALVLDHLALRVHGVGRHRVQQPAHPIRFQVQREVQRIRGDVDVVVRAIRFGRGVVGAPNGFEQRVELAVLHVAGPHEHEVFEQVCEPCAPGLLARRPDVVPDVHGQERHRVILVQDDVESVGQGELRVRHLESSFRAGRSRRRRLSVNDEAGRHDRG